jgi:signal transduction histidine kinase
MLADVLEGMRGRLVDQLARQVAVAGPPALSLGDRRSRLDGHFGRVIEALRAGAPGDGGRPALPTDDPERELAEHELVQGFLLEQIKNGRLAVRPGDDAILDRWRCHADRESLREQNRRLGALLDGLSEGAAVLSPDGRILYCNRRAAQVVRETARLARHEIIGRSFEELGIPLEAIIGHSVSELPGLARARESFEVNFWGQSREAQLDAIYEPDGTVGAIALLVRNIRSRKQAQLRLDILSKLGALVGALDYDQVAEDLASVPIPELADWCAFSVVEEQHVQRTYLANRDPSQTPLREALLRSAPTWDRHPLWQGMLSGGCQLLTEVSDDLVRKLAVNEEQLRLLAQLRLRSLVIVPLATRGSATGIITLAYTAGSGRRYAGDDLALVQELALHAARALENARLLKELRSSEARFRVALAGARTVVFEQDTSLRYTWFYNPLTGDDDRCPPDESLPADEAATLARAKQRVLEEGEGIREELDLTMGTDEQRHYREAIEPVRDHAGKVVGLIGAATDITEQRRMQQELANDVAFRERMMGILSHDLRNPLNAITLSADLLLRRELPPDERGQVLRINRAATRMQEMIETLLDFTRLRFLGKLPMSFAPTDLGEIARSVVDEVRAGRPDRPIELRVQGETRGQWDPARLSQALSNLVGNALAYGAPETPIAVAVSGGERDVVVTVNNRGDPIPACLLPVIFEPFRRGVSEDQSPHGLGLGLHVVQQIVLAHDGEISVASNADEGTTFTLRLPRARPPAPAEDEPS